MNVIIAPDKDYPFVEKPSEELFCPLTKGLLVQPHLTSCCGYHLAEESAVKNKKDGKPCPLCKSVEWQTMLSKHLRRQVRGLCVFCCYKALGCAWEGELSKYEQHVQPCAFRYVLTNFIIE